MALSLCRLREYFKQEPLKSITAKRIIEYRAWRPEQGVGPATLNAELGILRRIMKRARIWARVADDTYADGMPLHQVEYLCCKLILRPNKFVSRESLFDFGKVLRAPAKDHDVNGVLSVDDKAVARQTMPHTFPFFISFDETFDVGVDMRTGVDDNDYQPPFRLTGTFDKVTVELLPPRGRLRRKTSSNEKLRKP